MKHVKHAISAVAKWGIFPPLFFLVFFSILTFPLILTFSSHLWADRKDGLISVWNLWWVHKAVVQLHQSPWHTAYLQAPFGTTLLGHCMTPFKGFLAIPLLQFLPLFQTYNVIMIFSFVVAGITAFFLSFHLTKDYASSLLAGFVYTFSSFHFSHADGGHMHMISMEWIPLFILFWYHLLTRPGMVHGGAAAIALFIVILSDYQFFVFCFLAALVMAGWFAVRKKDILFFLHGDHLSGSMAFLTIFLITTAPLIFGFLLANALDPFWSSGGTIEFSMDLLAPFIPGGHWFFGDLTIAYWSRLPCNTYESSVYLGFVVLFLIGTLWIKRRRTDLPDMGLWCLLLLFFTLLALGPVPHVGGKIIPHVSLPYAWLQKILPILHIARAPVRMMVMTTCMASILAAAGFKLLRQRSKKAPWLALALFFLLCIEYLPRFSSIPIQVLEVPSYVRFLRNTPGNDALIDVTTAFAEDELGGLVRYYQTIHEKPMAFGSIARTPISIYRKKIEFMKLLSEDKYFSLAHDYHFRYLVTHDDLSKVGDLPHAKLLLQEGDVRLYDLAD